MIDTSLELINKMRGIQTTSCRVNILDTPSVSTFRHVLNDIEQFLIQNGSAKYLDYQNYYKLKQINNCITNETAKYAMFENDGIKLNGTENVLSENAKSVQIGYMSNSLSDTNGDFGTPVEFEWDCSIYEHKKFNIVFSKIRKEYAKDFDIEIGYGTGEFDEYDVEIFETETINVTNNTETTYTLDSFPRGTGYYTIKIKMYNWSVPNARAKITDLFFGEMLEYTDNEIASLDVKKGIDLTNESLESKELELVIIDEENEYNIFEPQGKLANLNTNSRIAIELGCVIDNFIYYVKVDEFSLAQVTKKENELEVKIKGVGKIQEYADTNFLFCFWNKMDLKTLCEGYGGYENESYIEADDELIAEDLKFRTEYGICDFITGIEKVATACRANIVETVDNNILFKRIKQKNPVLKIGLENMLTNPKIEKTETPKKIVIKQYAPTEKASENIFDADIVWKEGDDNIFNYNCEHTKGPYNLRRYFTQIDGSEQYVDIGEDDGLLCYDSFCVFQPAFADNEKHRVIVTGTKIELNSIDMLYENKTGTTERTIDNESIDTWIQGKFIYYWLINNYLKCFKFEVELQDTFTYELGDTVELETGIEVNGNMINKNAIVTGIEYTYKGFLDYRLTLKGA